jgi:subtilisin
MRPRRPAPGRDRPARPRRATVRSAVLPALLSAGVLLLAGALQAPAAGGSGPRPDDDRIPGQFIVVVSDTASLAQTIDRAEQRYDASVHDVYSTALSGFAAMIRPRDALVLADDPDVVSVQPDLRVQAEAQQAPTGVRRSKALMRPTPRGGAAARGVDADVAVIDTGVDLNHPDLNVYRRGAHNCATGTTTADDQNGHGTHVAGTVGALDNTTGVVGVAPGARIWPVRVFGPRGAGSLSDVICGVDYVTRHAKQIDVANMSLSSSGGREDDNCGWVYHDALHQAICASVEAGVTYVVAAGNNGGSAAMVSPASYHEVITVSALADFNGRGGGGAAATCRPDVDDTFADFSNHGPGIDLTAPGVCIRSTWMGGTYETLSGTSMASPHVAGAAARYVARHPRATPAGVRAALRAAGSSAWNDVDDPDGTKEPLLRLSGL